MGVELIPVRGRVYMADIGNGRKPWLAVSNNRRNRALRSCLAVRITTTVKPIMPTIIELGPNDPLVGRILCDDIAILYSDDLDEDRGALSRDTMQAVAQGLLAALAL